MSSSPSTETGAETTVKTIMRSVTVDQLRPGVTLASPIYGEDGHKLVDPGDALTEAVVEELRRRGRTVYVCQDDLARLNAYRPQGVSSDVPPLRRHTRNPLTREISEQLDLILESGKLDVDVEGPPFLRSVKRHPAVGYDEAVRAAFLSQHERSVRDVERVVQQLAHGEPTTLSTLVSAIDNALDRMREDMDLFLALIANPYYTRSVGRNSYHVACLAMAVGAHLELDQRSLVDLGMGCAVHDIGMLYLREGLHLRKRRLGPNEFVTITDHPIHTMTALRPYHDELSPASRTVAFQVHERCDGSGYPQGHAASRTHDLAKIAAVADSYIAMVSPRPYRDGIIPYFAVKSLLRDVQNGLYDSRAVRGLLHAVSLFPIGSYVGLTPRLVGRVIRGNVEQYDMPVVEVWDVKKPRSKPAVVDLRQCDIAIAEAIDMAGDEKWKEILAAIDGSTDVHR